MRNYYDTIIIGGGISGLYTAYQILKSNKDSSVLVLEKQKNLGGRIFTFHDFAMYVEAGAGRIQSGQKRIIGLLRELGLKERLTPHLSSTVFVEADGLQKSLNKKSDIDIFIKRILNSDTNINDDDLRKMTILEYVGTTGILSADEIQLFKDSFGYYSELVLMNAYDCIQTFKILSGRFYGLNGGLSQIIDELAERVRTMGGRITKGCRVTNINKEMLNSGISQFQVIADSGKRVYYGSKCICTLPVPSIKKLVFGYMNRERLDSLLKAVHCAPLCRIYCKFTTLDNTSGNVRRGVWFAGMPKMTTNNYLRYIIPIDEDAGIIMLSYTDNIFAEFWYDLYKTQGIRSVNRELKRLVSDSLGITIPTPIETKVFYWKCGVGYWGVGYNSRLVSREISQPFGSDIPFYICGENFAEKGQQWIEGSLETADVVLRKLL